MKGLLTGRTVAITGGAAGIGLATARALLREGACVALLDIDGDAARSAASDLTSSYGGAYGFAADVTDVKSISRAVLEATEELGSLDSLVNNAGVAGLGSVHESSVESWQRIWSVNVLGTFLASRAVLPNMIEQGGGAIVNVGSVAGLVGIPGMAAYCAAKGAIVNLTRQMAAEYGKYGVRVNCVCPGTVAETAMGKSLLGSDHNPEALDKRLAKYPLGRFGRSPEVAEAVAFFLSDAAGFCAGSILAVDGGMTAL